MSEQTAPLVPPSQIAKDSLRAWLLATRPATLTVGVIPVLVGTAVAHSMGSVRPLAALAALLGAICIQIGTNLANDVFDFEKGADTAERLGPLRVTQAGLIAPQRVRLGMYVSFALATVMGLYLTWVAGPVIVLIGGLSIASGVAYTGGPFPLGYNGLGDLFVLIFFGLVAVCGTVFVQAGQLSLLSYLASLPVGAIATAVLVVNNLRDGPTDVKAGKRTLVVRFGRGFGVAEYLLLLGVAYAVPCYLAGAGLCGRFVLLPLLTLPLAIPLGRSIVRDHGAVLNGTLAATARLLLLFGTLFAIGIVL
jgi:1,4-dihydroxy-2-naphthoate octaprenyltransferase